MPDQDFIDDLTPVPIRALRLEMKHVLRELDWLDPHKAELLCRSIKMILVAGECFDEAAFMRQQEKRYRAAIASRAAHRAHRTMKKRKKASQR